MKIEPKIESWRKQNRDFNLKAIVGKVAISMSSLEFDTALILAVEFVC